MGLSAWSLLAQRCEVSSEGSTLSLQQFSTYEAIPLLKAITIVSTTLALR